MSNGRFVMYIKILQFILIVLAYGLNFTNCSKQIGPDPWDYESNSNHEYKDETPPDLISGPTKKISAVNNGVGDWFYKRLLAVVLKGGHIQKQEDGSVDISLQMRVTEERWRVMEEYILFESTLSEDMLRRSMGYVEDSIYKPTITEKIAMAWSEYIQIYLIEYKVQLTWFFSLFAIVLSIFWLWNHISHNHVIIILFTVLYLYEAYVSYKEAEKQELDRFIKAVNTCKWMIWSSKCEVPAPDPLIFLKHMNPLKIAIRIFTTLISEPMLTISGTINILVEGLTDGLWYPLDKIMYGVIVFFFDVLIIVLLVIIVFNYILNIPFNLQLPGLKLGLKQHKRNLPNTQPIPSREDNVDRISGENLKRLLDVCSLAQSNLTANTTPMNQNMLCNSKTTNKLKRSLSAGRLPSIANYSNFKFKHNGSGDA